MKVNFFVLVIINFLLTNCSSDNLFIEEGYKDVNALKEMAS